MREIGFELERCSLTDKVIFVRAIVWIASKVSVERKPGSQRHSLDLTLGRLGSITEASKLFEVWIILPKLLLAGDSMYALVQGQIRKENVTDGLNVVV